MTTPYYDPVHDPELWAELDTPGEPALTCMFCGQPEHVELADAWTDHTFIFDTCCEGLHEAIVAEMNDPETGDAYRLQLLRRCGAEELLQRELRRVPLADMQFLLDYQLTIRPVTLAQAKAFIAEHHEHCPPPTCWRFGASIWNGLTCLGVVTVGNPASRVLTQRGGIVEVNRLCLDRGIPDELRWKACSLLYTWAAEEARRRGFAKIITYTLASETGMSLRYARWKPEEQVRARSWNTRSRPRTDKTPVVPKVRWSRQLAA